MITISDTINWRTFGKRVTLHMGSRSVRECATSAGLSPATMHRAMLGERVNAENFVALERWMAKTEGRTDG